MKKEQEKQEHESLLVRSGSEGGVGRWARRAAKGLWVRGWLDGSRARGSRINLSLLRQAAE